ncbi:MAG TPA: GGDEF domain-containing protein [Cellvibrionaceae bacterium]|nr:GGDEF domain-containing protein [Cellvibrionaceae bacterium]
MWWGAFTDSFSGGNTQFEYKNESQTAIECTMGDAGSFNMCGNNCVFADHNVVSHERLLSDLAFASEISPQISLDLSGYSGVWIDIDYRGPANFIHLSLQNHEPALNLPDPNRQFRPQSVGIATSELHKPVYVRLKEFKVSDWWVKQFALHRTESDTHFNRIRAIAIEIKEQPAHSTHYVDIKSITFVGEWISKENFYLAIIVAFVTLLGLEGAFRIHALYNRHRAAQKSLDALNEHNQKLQSVAFKDELTQLLNRRAIHEIINKSPDLKSPTSHAIIIIDIDHFKRFNDTYGHALGDKVLVTVAQALKQASRDYDQIARWGGEEFVIITRSATQDNLLAYAEKLREKVATTPVSQEGSTDNIFITISLGVTQRHFDESFDLALERADKALYQSKEKGRNCSTFII